MIIFRPDEELVEKTHSSTEVFSGSIIKVRLDEAQTPDGKIAKREVVEHPGGAVVIPILDNGNLILVKQFRYPLGHVLYEFPAGKLDPGETPLVSIQRELEEETGFIATDWTELTAIYTSPGFCNEKIYVYKASGITLSENPRREEDEFIDVIELPADAVRQMIQNREIIDAKTICAFSFVMPVINVV